MTSFGLRLKQLRTDNRLTQKEMGEWLGVSGNYISMLETGREAPSDQFIKLAASRFHVREEWLRDGEYPMMVPIDQLFEPIRKAIEQQGEPAKLALKMAMAKAQLYDEFFKTIPIEDFELLAIIAYLKKVWASGDPDLRAWLRVQFRRAFPDYEEMLKKDDAADLA